MLPNGLGNALNSSLKCQSRCPCGAKVDVETKMLTPEMGFKCWN